MTNKREVRAAQMRLAQTENDEMLVEGYAVVFDSETVLWECDGVQYKEVISRGALDGADLTDVPFKYNHSDNVMVMARTRNKTLTLTVDDKGLLVRASLANTTAGRDLYELIKRGDVDKMSFAFTVQADAYDNLTHTRSITKIKKLYDVAAVDLPAYDDTSIAARGYYEAAEGERERLLLLTYL